MQPKKEITYLYQNNLNNITSMKGISNVPDISKKTIIIFNFLHNTHYTIYVYEFFIVGTLFQISIFIFVSLCLIRVFKWFYFFTILKFSYKDDIARY